MLRTQLLLFQPRQALQQVISLAHILLVIFPSTVEAQDEGGGECATQKRQQDGVAIPVAWGVRRQVDPWCADTSQTAKCEDDPDASGPDGRCGAIVRGLEDEEVSLLISTDGFAEKGDYGLTQVKYIG